MAISLRFGVELQIGNRKTMGNPAINNYQDSEGKWFWIVGLEGERHWPPLARAAGHPEWIDDSRFAQPADRAANAEALIGMLDEIFATKTRAEWGEIFDAEVDLWWAPVQTVQEVLNDPQAQAAGGFVEIPDGDTTTTLPATPVDFSATPCVHSHMAPEPGQHGDDVLGELGWSREKIDALRAAGVLG
jgi:crotonobetainyl-CoA:carnitine CoA-transferase CaiB-like acyl-CoA transferase